jgi:hypothetical protein
VVNVEAAVLYSLAMPSESLDGQQVNIDAGPKRQSVLEEFGRKHDRWGLVLEAELAGDEAGG